MTDPVRMFKRAEELKQQLNDITRIIDALGGYDQAPKDVVYLKGKLMGELHALEAEGGVV